MGLHHLDESGNLGWHCPHNPEDRGACGAHNTAHISHDQVEWIGTPDIPEHHHSIALPPCSGCGARTFLKVSFTEQELKAPNMWLEWNSWWEERLQQAEQEYKAGGEPTHLQTLAAQIQQLRAAKEAGGVHTDSHAMAQRHIELSKQMRTAGKHPNIAQQSTAVMPEPQKTSEQLLDNAKAMMEAHGLNVFVVPTEEGEEIQTNAESISE